MPRPKFGSYDLYTGHVNIGEPFGGLLPGARGAVLAILLRTGAPLTGRRIHVLLADRHSLGSVQRALRDLDRLGVITTETVGRAGVHRVNDRHAVIAPLRAIANPIDMLTDVVKHVAGGVDAVLLFGSSARGDTHADSDIDLAVIANGDWDGRTELQQEVQDRIGNQCDVLHLTQDQFHLPDGDREPVVDDIMRDGIALIGSLPRQRAMS